MSVSGSARERVLDAFELLLIEQGERGATLDATAARAEVSKGGLLYHFANREALITGLIERTHARAAEDSALMLAAPEGVVDYLLRSSVYADEPFDRTVIAITRLAQSENPRAAAALSEIREGWLRIVCDHVPSPAIAETIVLISDGLYFNSTLDVGSPTPGLALEPIDAILEVVGHLLRPRPE